MLGRLHEAISHSCLRHGNRYGYKSISTLGRRPRYRNNLDLSSIVTVLDRKIVQYFAHSQGRSFSHLYRKHKATPPNATWLSNSSDDSRPEVSGVQWHTGQPSNHRSYATNYRKYSSSLLYRLSSITHTLFPHDTDYASKNIGSATIADMLGVRSFSHTYRKRQLAPIKAYLPSYSLGAHNRRYISSVTSGNVGSNSAQGSRTSRVAWVTRVMAAGITVILALRFLEDKAEVESHGLSDSVYTAWEIFNVEQVSPSASVFTLKAKPGATVSGFVPLSSVSIKEPNSNIQRPYTILSLEEDRIKILVKRYDGGELSRFIHSRKLEAELFLKRVPSEYTLPEKVPSKFVLISGGTGVATSYQLLRHFATLPAQDRPEVRVLYASVNEDEVYLQEEFKELKESLGGKLHIEYFIDSWGAVIDSKDVQNAYRDWESATTLVCGSDGFVEFIAGRKPEIGQGSIGGLLAANGIGENVWKL